MLISSLESALHWQSLVNKAKGGDKSALELIHKTDKENLEAGDPSVENQLKNMQKDNDGSLISNNGIDWKNRGYKVIPEIDSVTAAVRVLEYYYSMEEDKVIQSWYDMTDNTLDGYVAIIGYQLILEGKTLYEQWRDEMFDRLKNIFSHISEYQLKKAIAQIWTKNFNLSKIGRNDSLCLLARKERYSICRLFNNDKSFGIIYVIWPLSLFFWLIYKHYQIGSIICLVISFLCAYNTKDIGLSKLPLKIVFFLLLSCCIMIALSTQVEMLYYYGSEYAIYISIWSIIALLLSPIFKMHEEISKENELLKKDIL